MESKKHVQVAAAVITRTNADGTTEIFCAQRPGPKPEKEANETNYKWEFPGGKLEQGETPEQALVREIKEELDTEIAINKFVTTVTYEYNSFIITMHCYFCTVKSGSLVLKEHLASRWLTIQQLNCMDWAPADIEAVKAVIKNIPKK